MSHARRHCLRLGAPMLLALLALVGTLCASACGNSDHPVPAERVDSGAQLSCVVGTLNCRCNVAAACAGDLLCVAGRCVQTEGSGGIDKPPVFPTTNIGGIVDASAPVPDASEPMHDAAPDAASSLLGDAGDAASDAGS